MTKEPLSQRQLFLISKGNEVTCLKINSNTINPLDPNDYFCFSMEIKKSHCAKKAQKFHLALSFFLSSKDQCVSRKISSYP
jgi:hypothetical protein